MIILQCGLNMIVEKRECPVCILEGENRMMIPTRLGKIEAIFWYCPDCNAYLDYRPVRRKGEVERLLSGTGEFEGIEIRNS